MAAKEEKELERLRRDKLKAINKNDRRGLATACNLLGEQFATLGKYNEALEEHNEELDCSEALDDLLGVAIAHRKIGECYSELSEHNKALEHQKQYLQLALSLDNLVEQQRAWATIGRTYLYQFEIETDVQKGEETLLRSKKAFLDSLNVCEQLKDLLKPPELMEMKARLLLNLGVVHNNEHDSKGSVEYIKQAIFLAKKFNLYEDVYRCHYNLADMYEQNDNLGKALRHMEEALKSAKIVKDVKAESHALYKKAQIFFHLKDFAGAKHCLKKAYRLNTPVKLDRIKIQKFLNSVSIICKADEKILTLNDTDLTTKMKLYEQMGDSCAGVKVFQQALVYYSLMLECAEKLKLSKTKMLPIYISLAQTYADTKVYDKAVYYFYKELDCEKGKLDQECQTWINIAEYELLSGKDYDTVFQAYSQALMCAEKTKNKKMQLRILHDICYVQQKFNKTSDLSQTESKLSQFKQTCHFSSDDECDEEEDLEEENEVLTDLSDSDLSVDENNETERNRGTGRAKNIMKRNEKGETPLHRAVIEGNFKRVKTLIEQGHAVNPRDNAGWLPIHEASNHDLCEIAEYLLDHGAWINDRVGEQCGGITPLNDAASCGNLDMMKLLIKKGALIDTCDNDGNTPLDSLMAWMKRTESDLDPDIIRDTKALEKFLKMHTKKTGSLQGDNIRKTSVLQENEFKELERINCSQDSNLENNKWKRQNEVTKRFEPENSIKNSKINKEKQKNKQVNQSEIFSDQDIYNNYSKIHTTPQNDVTKIYANTMQSLGSHSKHSSQSSTTLPSVKPAPALVNEDEITEDWLINDVEERPQKRKRRDVDNIFSTSHSRFSSNKLHSQFKKLPSHLEKNKSRRAPLISDVDSLPNTSQSNLSHKSLLPQNLDEDMNTFENFSDDSSSSENLNQNCLIIKKKKLKQSKLTLTLQNNVEREESISRICAPESIPLARTFEEPIFSGFVTSAPLRVKVRIKDKLLLIPIPSSNVNKTVGWLADEAARRYYNVCGLKPVLTLSTKDGAVLSSDDIVTHVITSDEEILSKVNHWDLPPLPQRYKEACIASDSVAYRNIQTCLQICQSTDKLHLKNLALKLKDASPVFRAIQCQYTLREMDLSGNRLGDDGLVALVAALPTIPNLNILRLACNNITHMGLKIIADSFENLGNDQELNQLQVLSEIDLSYNPLEDASATSLVTIFRCLPALQSISLISCNFTPHFFQLKKMELEQTLKGPSKLQKLSFGGNKLQSLGIELLVQCLPVTSLIYLNLTSTIQSYQNNHVCRTLGWYLSQNSCALEELILNDCYLLDENLQELARNIGNAKFLRRISFALNPKVSGISINVLLQTAYEQSIPIESLNICGCNLTCQESILLEQLKINLSSGQPLKKLSLTANEKMIAAIEELWQSQHGKNTQVLHSFPSIWTFQILKEN